MNPEPSRHLGKMLGYLLGAGLLLSSVGAVAQTVVVPDVVTLLLSDAEAVLISAGLSPALENTGCSDELPLTAILSQSPPAGAEVSRGETIFLIMVSGPCSVTVPDIQGLNFDVAEIALFDAGLNRGELTVECSDTVPAASIIRQDPPPGTVVQAGTAVDVWVSNGECLRVPDVIGFTQAEAEARITSVGLLVGAVLPACDDRYPPGVITGQSPEALSAVDPGTLVTLQISAVCLPVPDVRDLSLAEALSSVRAAGFIAGVVWQQCSNTVTADAVISQWPDPGTPHVPGSQVDLVLSSGPCPVSVPAVEGQAQDTAQAAITDAGLTIGLIIQQCSNTVPAGQVIFQRPAAGTQLAQEEAVDLVVSTGACEQYISVPTLTDLTESAATLQITAANLYLNQVSQQCSDAVPAGRVISQSPAPGSLVMPGAAVDLVVSTGGCPVVPDVTGLTREAAVDSLSAAGLVEGFIVQECDGTIPAGQIIAQSPAPGVSAAVGTAVNLVISTGLCNATVPDVSGMDETNAQSAIVEAGLAAGQVSRQCSDTAPERQVISQNPAAGTPVSLGIPVSIVVSAGACLSAPQVTGLSLTDAQAQLENVGFGVGTVGQSCNDAIPEGEVISQSPPAGTPVSAAAAFDLVISSGPCPVTVPAVEGRSESVARAILTTGRLNTGSITTACSDTVPVGSVISQNPAAGTKVAPDTAVSLVLASGPCTVVLPNVIGQTETQARDALAAAGMTVRTVYECDEVPENQVISQTPAGGVLITLGTEVTLVVSSGPCTPQVTVPEVIGQNQLVATSALIAAGLQVDTVTELCSDTVPAGAVISQDPISGTQTEAGTEVSLVVSSGPCALQVTVPEVIGQNQLAATSALIAAGLQIYTVTEQCSDTVPAGTVISQTPDAGTQTTAGSAVNLVIASGPCGEITPSATVLVPDLISQSEAEARQLLLQAGLQPGESLHVFSNTANPGVIIGQAPLSGVEVPSGSAVSLRVSRGVNPLPPSDKDILQILYDRFDALDKDKNQRLSLEEVVRPEGLPGLSIETFNGIDLNRDGLLSQYELEQYLQLEGLFSCLKRLMIKEMLLRSAGDFLLAGLGLILLAALRSGRYRG